MTLPPEFKPFANAEGRIERLPVREQKKVELAHWLVSLLDPETSYNEKQINEYFGRYVDDFALIRRMLVESGELKRDRYGYEYRRKP